MAAVLRINDDVFHDVELAVFDKDGTLICVHTYWKNMVEMRAAIICERLGLGLEHKESLMDRMGVDLPKGRIKEGGPVGIKKRQIVLQAAVDYLVSLGISDPLRIVEEVSLEVDEISLQQFDKIVRPIDGLYRLMDDLIKQDVKIAIATTDLTQRAEKVMAHLGLADKLVFIVGADMVKQTKPAPDMLHLITQRLGVPSERSIMVGDAVTDIQMGFNAEFRASIGVSSGLTSPETLMKFTPFVVPNISHILIDSRVRH